MTPYLCFNFFIKELFSKVVQSIMCTVIVQIQRIQDKPVTSSE